MLWLKVYVIATNYLHPLLLDQVIKKKNHDSCLLGSYLVHEMFHAFREEITHFFASVTLKIWETVVGGKKCINRIFNSNIFSLF